VVGVLYLLLMVGMHSNRVVQRLGMVVSLLLEMMVLVHGASAARRWVELGRELLSCHSTSVGGIGILNHRLLLSRHLLDCVHVEDGTAE